MNGVISRISKELADVAATVERNSKELLEQAQATQTGNPLRVGGYAFPVTPPATDWYCAQYHTWTPGSPGGHTGLDINLTSGGDSDLGQPVYSTCNGVVVYAQQAPGAYWGNLVIVLGQDDDGLIYWRYAHLDKIHTSTGAHLLAGEQVGTVGKGGQNRYWAHLHLDAWRGGMLAAGQYRTQYVHWVDPLTVWAAAGYKWNWGKR